MIRENDIEKLRKLNKLLKMQKSQGLLVNSSFYYSKFHHWNLKNSNLTNLDVISFSEIVHFTNLNWPYDYISNFNNNFKKNEKLLTDLKNRMTDFFLLPV